MTAPAEDRQLDSCTTHRQDRHSGSCGAIAASSREAPERGLFAELHPGPAEVAALDRVLTTGPYVLIAPDNTSPARVSTLDDAQAALRRGEAASAGGTLKRGVLAVDVDPADTGADPVLGDAVVEALTAWCMKHGVRWLVRESGRPGGRHVIAVTESHELAVGWAKECQRLGRLYRVRITQRAGMVLRLLSAPHRLGLPAPVLGGTLTVVDVLDVVDDQPCRSGRVHRLRPAVGRSSGQPDRSRSAREYGQVCAMVRRGCTAAQAWAKVSTVGSKSRERGEVAWRAYVWLSAVTAVAAEDGVTEDEAWRRAQLACRTRCQLLGREGWRAAHWRRAVQEARRARPRRYRLPEDTTATITPQQQAEIDAVRRGLSAAAEELLTARGMRPQRRQSAAAILYELAAAIVRRDGSLDGRTLAERVRRDPKTVRAARNCLVEAGVLVITHEYAGGAQDCHAYAVGPAAQSYVEAARQTSPTSCSTPPAPGRSCPHRLRRTHTQERQTWRLRCVLSAHTEATAETFAQSQHPAARALRSLHYQRRWWRSLTSEQQDDRREMRRTLLGQLGGSERRAWFLWLDRRALIAVSADHIAAGTAISVDYDVITHAPMTLYRGMRDPQWRTGGTPLHPGGEQPAQLELLVA